MNTSNMIPISYVKSITPLVMGDGWGNTIGQTGTLDDIDYKSVNEFKDIHLFITSFADRPNTGRQPVGDGVLIDAEFHSGSHAYDMQPDYFDWSLEAGDVAKTWKPNHSAMLSDYKKTQEPKEGDTIQVPFSEMPITKHSQYDVVSPSDFGAVKDDKPVFTQVMKDAGEFPLIGSQVCFENENVTIVGFTTKGMPIFETPDGYVDSFNSKSLYTPIDTRSDHEKCFNDLNKVRRIFVEDVNKLISDIKDDKIHGVKWVGE